MSYERLLNVFKRAVYLYFVVILLCNGVLAQTITQTYSVSGTGSFTVPTSVTSLTIECWGGGGPGGASRSHSSGSNGGGGGGGGAYVRVTQNVTAGSVYSYTVGASYASTSTTANTETGNPTIFGAPVQVKAVGGYAAGRGTSGTLYGGGGAGGAAADCTPSSGTNWLAVSGGNGATAASGGGGGGGESGGPSGTGNTGGVTAGGTGNSDAGNGGAGGASGGNNTGTIGSAPGGGGGGAWRNAGATYTLGGSGAAGQIRITYCPDATITRTSAAATTSQTVCISNAITNITYTVNSGATGATVSGLPTGVSGSYSSGTVTISGSPSVAGTYNYTVNTTGSCTQTSTTGTIISLQPTMTSSSAPSVCTGSAVNLSLTSDVTSSYVWQAADNGNTSGETYLNSAATATITDVITNTTTANQTVTYTVTPTSVSGSCPGVSQTVNVTVHPKPSMTSATSTTVCSGVSVGFALTSDLSSAYSWQAADNLNTTGETLAGGSGSSITDVITNSSGVNRIVEYTITPTSTAHSCSGSSQTVYVQVDYGPPNQPSQITGNSH